MKSRITIEVDFENGNDSAIYIKHEPTDDIRDKLVQDFLGKFAGQSNWCRAEFLPDRLRIKPITAPQLGVEAGLMNLMVNKYSASSSPTPPLPLHKPLDYEIPELLKELKYGRPAKAQHMIDTLIDAWEWMVNGGIVICRDAEAKESNVRPFDIFLDGNPFTVYSNLIPCLTLYERDNIDTEFYAIYKLNGIGMPHSLVEPTEDFIKVEEGDRFITCDKSERQ